MEDFFETNHSTLNSRGVWKSRREYTDFEQVKSQAWMHWRNKDVTVVKIESSKILYAMDETKITG